MIRAVSLPAQQLRRRKRIFVAIVMAVLAIEVAGVASTPVRISAESAVSEAMLGHALFPGTIIGDTRYGVTFSGLAAGDLPGWWTVTVNYSPSSAGGGMVNTIVGGRWQVTQVENGIYRGTIYGEVVAGRINRDPTGVFADVSVDFLVTGGTGAYAGASGSGSLLEGKADHTPFPPTLAGRIALNLDRDS